MNNYVAQDLRDSTKRLKKAILPELEKKMPGSEFIIVEGITVEEMRKKLDMLAGIDLWHVDKNGIRGVASRTQKIHESDLKKHWFSNGLTFTVRRKRDSGGRTEYEKRLHSIENDYLYPYLTLHGYTTHDNELIDYAVARTVDIINMAKIGLTEDRRTRKDKHGQADFFAIPWYWVGCSSQGVYIHSEHKDKMTVYEALNICSTTEPLSGQVAMFNGT